MAVRLILRTERLELRELTSDDLGRLHEILSDPDVARTIDDLEPYTLDKTRRTLALALEGYRTTPYGPWAFVDKETGTIAGLGGVEMLPGREIPELTFIFAAAFWGKGLATEVARACLEYASATLGCERIGASVDPGNEASIQVIEKLGMTRVRTGSDEFGMPAVFYELLRR